MISEPLLGVLLSWFPMFVLMGLFVFFIFRVGGLKKGGMTQMDYMEGLLLEIRRSNVVLESILKKMDERVEKLEADSRS